MEAPQAEPPQQRPEQRPGRLVILGGAVALAAGAAIAWALLSQDGEQPAPPPASEGGLVIESAPEDGRIDPARPLRCFVEGQSVGELTLAECARRNGVATDALDVGVDETGALAAAGQAGVMLTPLPPQDAAEAAPLPDVAPSPAPEAGPALQVAACWRHQSGQWRRLPGDLDLSSCAQALFAGRCERPGQASYGRWGSQTLRLVTGRIEVSADNQSFRTLAMQGPNCSVPPLG